MAADFRLEILTFLVKFSKKKSVIIELVNRRFVLPGLYVKLYTNLIHCLN